MSMNHQDSSSPTNMGSRKNSSGMAHSPYAHPALRSCDQSYGQQTANLQAPVSGGSYNSSGSSSHGSENGELNQYQQQQQQPQQFPPHPTAATGRGPQSGASAHTSAPNSGTWQGPTPTGSAPSSGNWQAGNKSAPPPPPSYIQATVNAAREWTNNSPPSEKEDTQHNHPPGATPPHTPEIDSGAQSTYSNNQGYNGNNRGHHQQNNSQNIVPSSAAANNAPEGAYHGPLFGQCEWIQPPPVPQIEQPTPAYPCYRLFLGQIRFETTPAEVKWIIEYVTGVQALKVETRGIGCFLAYFQTYDDMVATQQLHKRILFDHTGIWFARTDEQALAMQEYVKAALSRIGRGFRLPKDMMVVEEEKLQRALPIPCAPPKYNQMGPGSSNNNASGNNNNFHPHGPAPNAGQQQQSRFPQHATQKFGGGQPQQQPHSGQYNNASPFPTHSYTHHSQQQPKSGPYSNGPYSNGSQNSYQQQQQQYHGQQPNSGDYNNHQQYQQPQSFSEANFNQIPEYQPGHQQQQQYYN